MKTARFIYSAVTAASLALSLQAGAQSVEILGFTADPRASQIKARVDLDGKQIRGVTAYSYNMENGASQTSSSYELVDGKYLTANVDCYSGIYTAFQLKLDFTDGTRYVSECVSPDLTEGFYWLGDLTWQSAQSGWNSTTIDGSIDNGVLIKLDDVMYYKGVSNHAPGQITYSLANQTLPGAGSGFKSFATRCGVQDTQYYGHLTFKFFTDGSLVDSREMYAKTYANRPANAPCVADVAFDLNGTDILKIEADKGPTNDGFDNWGDHAQLALARVYVNMPDRASKTPTTLSFDSPGQTLTKAFNLSTTLQGAEGPVYYRIVSGGNLATIDGSVLTPVWGSKGEVVVEACYYGDDSHDMTGTYEVFYVDMQPKVEILALYQPVEPDTKARGYVLVDTKGKALQSLKVRTFDNYYELNEGATVNLTPASSYEVVPFEIEADPDGVIKLEYTYAGESTSTVTPFWQNGEYFDYMSDLPSTIATGWGNPPAPNKPYGDATTTPNQVIELGAAGAYRKYAKGYGWHANGRAESTGDLSNYYKFSAEMGGQRINNNTHTSYLKFNVQNGAQYLRTDTVIGFSNILTVEGPINGLQKITINGMNNGDNTNAVVAVGAPRLYYSNTPKAPQSIVWETEEVVTGYRPMTITLDASAESGLEDIYYHVVQGNATINGKTLTINTPPTGGSEVIVEAQQPGNEAWGAAPALRKTFRVIRGLEVMRDQDITLNGSTQLDELTVHADRLSSGQVRVKNGVATVGTLLLKYTFVPGEWSYISFPSDANLEEISDFNAKGYSLNNEFGGAFYINEYNPMAESPWTSLTSPIVKAQKGYLMGINDGAGTEPVEITFTLRNSDLDLSMHQVPVDLTLDLSGMQNGQTQTISVTPDNVAGSSLDIDLVFKPDDASSLPVNYEQALRDARCTFVGEKKAMRFTLLDQTPARVVFFDAKGKNVIKAVRYVSPMAIDLTDMKPGKYNIVVEYGNALRTFSLEL